MVRLPSGVRYWTVLDEDLAVVPVADSFLRQVRFGRDGAESTTKAYAGGIALFLRWCARSGRSWEAGAGQLGLFMTWLAHAGRAVSGADAPAGVAVLAGPGSPAARSARRINAVLAAVRGRPHEVDGRSVWATYHPSAAIRFGPNGAPRARLAADLAAVAAELGTAA